MRNLQIKKILIIIGLIILCTSTYFNYQYYVFLQNPQKVADGDLQKIVNRVSKLVILPNDETPSIATVIDPDALKDQVFFVNSQKDDIVLVYSKSQKAILYRPSINKIIEIAPVNFDNKDIQTQQSTPVVEQNVENTSE